jgi:penicillin-binding protein 2
MKVDDFAQNLTARITVIQIIAVILLTALGVRLYYLQMMKGQYYEDKAYNQRIRLIRSPSARGAIFDRHGRLLVDSHTTYNVVLSREPMRGKTLDEILTMLKPVSEGLGIDEEDLRQKLIWIQKQPDFESTVIKENGTMDDLTWIEAHALEYPELRVELHPQRYYPMGTTAAHVLGYVGEISPKQLQNPEFQEKRFRPGDIIGKDGVEAYYDDVLRGREGYRKVVVDSRGRVQQELESVSPQAGQDMYLTIDIDLQRAAEEQLAKSSTKRGVIIVMDPNNGEILALASSPTFDPNAFVQRSTTPEGRAEINEYYKNPDKPLLNRAIRGRYYPGSTWKIPMSVAGFEQGAITVEDNAVLCGRGITIGSKYTRCMGNHGTPPLRYAITKSCDGYYYRLALKMKVEGLIKMVEEFEYDKKTGIELPGEYISRTPKTFLPIRLKNYPNRWLDIDSVFASIGQVYVEATPISMIRAVSSVGVGGKMFVPHLLKELKPIGAVGDPENPDTYQPEKPGRGFDHPEPKQIGINPEQNKIIVDGMWGVVNNGGTARKISMGSGWPIAGKTGTAQVAELGQDRGHKEDHSWFVSFAPAYKPEIAVIALIENAGFGADHAAPAVKGVYQAYLQKRNGGPVENQEVAMK